MTTSPPAFTVDAAEDGERRLITVTASDGKRHAYELPGNTQQHYVEFLAELARDFGTRMPHMLDEAVEHPPAHIRWRPLLTENIHRPRAQQQSRRPLDRQRSTADHRNPGEHDRARL